MIVLPFEPEHLTALRLQPMQTAISDMLSDPKYSRSLQQAGPAFSAMVDGEIIAALGIIPQWQNRAIAWGLIGANANRHLLGVHRAVDRFLKLTEYRRIETSVATNFAEGHRWAQMLGFKREGTMTAFTPDGRDCDLYARIV